MAEETPDQQEAKGGGKLKLIIMIAGVLVLEAVGIIGAMTVLGGPAEVDASEDLTAEVPEEEQIIEILVLDTRLPNSRAGATYLYQTEVYLQTKKAHQEMVSSHIEQFQNELKAEIAAIWKTSDPHHFEEPKLETLRRKVYALLNERFGADKESEEPIAQKCVIVMGTGMRVDG